MTTIKELDQRIIKIQDEQIKALESARQKEKELHAEELANATRLYTDAVKYVADQRDVAIALAEDYRQDVQHWQAQFDREHAAFEQAAADRDQAIRDKSDLRRRLHSVRNEYAHAAEALELKQAEYDVVIDQLERALTKQASLEQERDELKHKLEIANKHESESDQVCDECKKHTDEILAGLAEENKDWSMAYDELQRKIGDALELATDFIDHISEMIACDCEFSDIADEFMQWRGGKWTPEEAEDDLADMLEDVRQYETTHKWKVMVVEHEGDEAVFTGWFADYDLARESVDLMVSRGCYEAWVEEIQ